MNPKLSPEEKVLLEREFAAREEVSAKRRSFARGAFMVGMAAGLGAAALREFHVHTLVSPLLGIVWIICLMMYVGAGIFPGSFAKDLDLRWHLNPWQEALQHLSEGRTQVEAIALLAGPPLARMLFSFFYFGFK